MYPAELPLAEITAVVRVFREGTVKENVKDVAHDLWMIQGYAQKEFIGAPKLTFGAEAAVDPLEVLERLVNQAKQTEGVQAQVSPALAFVLKWAVDELVKLIEQELAS